MIISYFNIMRIAILEKKTDSPLIVDGNGVLSLPFSLQGMKVIARWNLQIIQAGSKINIFQAACGPSQQIRLQPPRFARYEEIPCVFVCKRFNHSDTLTCHVTLVKGYITQMSSIARSKSCDSKSIPLMS